MDQQNFNPPQFPSNPYAHQNIYGGIRQSAPNATAVLVLGIGSIIFCTLGPILGTIALVLAKGGIKAYNANPAAYDEQSFKNLKAGRTCAIIGLCVGILAWIALVAYFIFVFMMVREAQEQIDQAIYHSHY